MNKRLLTIILALAVALALAACRSNTEDPTAAPTEPTSVQTEAPETVEATEAPTELTIPGEPDPYDTLATAPSTEPTAEPTQPAAEETLPGDVDVSLGVVPGESTPDLDEEDGNGNSGTAQQPQTQPTTGENSGSNDAPVITEVTYESYIAMSGEQQQAFINQFASVEEFVKWYNASKEKYDAEHPDIEIGGDTVIDGSQLGKS